jgi:type IV pilus assembly protein PilM
LITITTGDYEKVGLGRLLSVKKDVFGLDIGSESVKAVQLQKTADGYKLIAAHRIQVQNDLSGFSGKSKTDTFVEAIHRCVKAARIKTKYAVCGVCGPEVAARRFTSPALAKNEVNDAVLFEAEQVCPFESGQFIVDYQLLYDANGNGNGNGKKKNALPESENPKLKGKTAGVLVAATPIIIGSKIQRVRSASLNCVLMDVDGLALLNCFRETEDDQTVGTTAILDIGSKFTNLAIMANNGLPFVRDTAYAGNDIVSKIAAETELPNEVIKHALCDPNAQGATVDRIAPYLEYACKRLIDDITETLRYFTIQESSVVDRVLVCGGMATCSPLIELLNENLPPEVTLWNPLDKIECGLNNNDAVAITSQGPSFALAIGLAMRSI